MTNLNDRQIRALHELLGDLDEQAQRAQGVCDRHADNPDSSTYRNYENKVTRILSKRRALAQLMQEAGI